MTPRLRVGEEGRRRGGSGTKETRAGEEEGGRKRGGKREWREKGEQEKVSAEKRRTFDGGSGKNSKQTISANCINKLQKKKTHGKSELNNMVVTCDNCVNYSPKALRCDSLSHMSTTFYCFSVSLPRR